MDTPRPIKRALLSVSDKTGIVDFARSLSQKGVDILNQIVADHSDILDEECEAGFKDFGDFSLGILFIYYIKPEAHWLDSQNTISKEVLRRFNEAKLDFAFPTQTIFKKEIQ